MGDTGSEDKGWIVKGIFEMGVVGGEGIPGEEGVASVGVSAEVGAEMIAKMGFTPL